jgi:hypothetical protein
MGYSRIRDLRQTNQTRALAMVCPRAMNWLLAMSERFPAVPFTQSEGERQSGQAGKTFEVMALTTSSALDFLVSCS